MQRFTSIAEQQAWSRDQHRAGRRIGFVPTMGALHEGHLSLIRQARQQSDVVVVSIFVNPTQFDRDEDLERYPEQSERDCELCADEGVEAVFLPTRAELYPDGYATFVEVVGPLTDKLCGVARPGHFRGVATVVSKLFNIVQPDVAVFGQKDIQQVLVIRRMIEDLNVPVELAVGPTVRESDGLAMSSRNQRLTTETRSKALALPRGLERANEAFRDGVYDSQRLIEILAEELLVQPGVDLDYADVVRLAGFEESDQADEGCILAAAAFIDGVRLIDHVHLGREELAVNLDA